MSVYMHIFSVFWLNFLNQVAVVAKGGNLYVLSLYITRLRGGNCIKENQTKMRPSHATSHFMHNIYHRIQEKVLTFWLLFMPLLILSLLNASIYKCYSKLWQNRLFFKPQHGKYLKVNFLVLQGRSVVCFLLQFFF